jgi:hypothetical protein
VSGIILPFLKQKSNLTIHFSWACIIFKKEKGGEYDVSLWCTTLGTWKKGVKYWIFAVMNKPNKKDVRNKRKKPEILL